MKSLTSRLTIWYALVVTLTVGALLFVGRFYLEHNMVEGIDLLNQVEFEEIRSRIDSQQAMDETQVVAAIRKHAELDAALYFFQVGHGHQEVIFKSSNLGPYQLPQAVHGKAQATVYDDELGLLRSAEFSYAGLDIHIVSSMQNMNALFDHYEQTCLLATGAVFVLSLGVGFLLSRLAIRPIAAIQSKARQITASSFGERIPVPNTDDEISRMASLLNEMLDRLEASYEQVKRFTAEASHELRTPLSIIRLQAEKLASENSLTPDERQEAALDQLEEVGRLNKLIDDMLLLAKADAGVMVIHAKTVHLSDFLKDFSDDAKLLAEEVGVHFRVEGAEDVQATLDPTWMRHVLLNLLSNALKVAPKGSDLCIQITKQTDGIAIAFMDEGPGLPESKLGAIFDRFERLDGCDVKQGNGLGLAICRSIIKRHGGRIVARNRTDRSGLVIDIFLPSELA